MKPIRMKRTWEKLLMFIAGSILMIGCLCGALTAAAESYVSSVLQEGAPINDDLYLKSDGALYYLQTRYVDEGRADVFDLHRLQNGKDEVLFDIPGYGLSDHSSISAFDLDEEGNLVTLFWLRDEDKLGMDTFDRSGARVASCDSIDAGNTGTIRFHLYDKQAFILHGDGKLNVYTMEGEYVRSLLQDRSVGDFAIDSAGRIYAITSIRGSDGSYRLVIADSQNGGQIIQERQIPNASSAYICYVEETGNVYLADETGVERYNPSEDTLESVADFAEAGVLLTKGWEAEIPQLQHFAVDANENIFLVSSTYPSGVGEQSTLRRLALSDARAEQAQPDVTLTITAAYQQDFLVEAVRRYTFLHPDVEIVWDVLYPSYESFFANQQDAGQRMAAKIMTNDVGDIVATGGMGIEYFSALQTDAFVDLHAYLDNDEILPDLNPAALEGITLNGELKGLPVGMGYPCFVYNRELGDSLGLTLPSELKWSDVLAIGIEHPEIPLFGMGAGGITEGYLLTILEDFVNVQMPDLIDLDEEQADFHQEWFVELLEDLKTVYQAGNLFTISNLSPFNKVYRTHLFETTVLRGTYDHTQLYIQNADGGIAYIPAPAGEIHRNAIAYPFRMYSISSNSENKEAAWAFLRYLLTPDIQGQYSLDAIPVNMEAERNQRSSRSYSDELNRQYEAIVNTVDFAYDYSGYKADLIYPIIEWLNGTLELEEALAEAEYNAWIRMNE
ncbi:MAG: extracellular solute-binding protein [Clostridia bacterium]|nr:extracellular solute-binding protein [Clostridia bacterium]